MLGIALGAFTQGFNQGVETGARLGEMREAGALRKGIKQATTEGTAEFESKVAAGEETAGDWQTAYSKYIVPKTAHQYAVAGQPDKAAQWLEWADSSNAKKGSKLFSSGLSKIQTGDTQGGIDDMVKAANLQGYGPDGKVTAAEYYDEAAGAVTGYRFSFEGPDGKPMTKNVAVEDVAQFLAGIANPQSAFELDQASKAARSKADLEVETHGRKKALEAQLGVGSGQLTQAQYQNAIQEERKAIEERSLTDPELEGLSSEEKEAMAKQIVDERFGKSSGRPEGPQIAVDPDTGEQVDLPAETPSQDAAQPTPSTEPTDEDLGVDDTPTSSVSPAPQAAPAQPAPGVTPPASSPAADTTGATDPTQQYLMQAQQALKQGANPQQIAQALQKAGVAPQQWPQDLQIAMRQNQLGLSR